MSYVEYDSNNSGGRWWLTDDDWRALEKAGWIVEWNTLETAFSDKGDYLRDPETGVPKLVPHGSQGHKLRLGVGSDGRFIGALAQRAYRPGLSLREAADEWERVTGQSSTDAGCSCCGQPHNFTEYDDAGKYAASGPEANYSASW